MSISFQHLQCLVAGNRGNFHGVEAFLEQAAGGFMAQIVEGEAGDACPATGAHVGFMDAIIRSTEHTRSSRLRGRASSVAMARLDSGTSRALPFFVLGRCAFSDPLLTIAGRR